MAAEEIKMFINVSDNGTTDVVIKKVRVLKDLLDKAAISAGKINVGGSMPQAPSRSTPVGTTPAGAGGATSTTSTSGKTTYSGALSQPSGAAAQAAGATYGATRGVASSTGSAASDFAEQAQGLSGLVRVYATFAANVYAVTAAFRVLSEAMNTANMVKGLDQLGAASGTNLGALSKRLVQATGNAISLREGMQSVAQASAAGISSANIIKIGESAKQASLILGVGMTDAVSRLSRGIVKLEPELLDELGLFTKLGESNRNYALTLGKSVSSLTDFEKRQGFANAVLEEAANKFGKIKLDTNPYDRLLASFKDLAQTGLELANKVLVPIVGFLAQSPTALMAVLAYIGATLISKTIPALGKWRESLKDAAAAATANAAKIKESFGPDFQDRLDNSFNLKTLDKNLELAKAKLESLKKVAITPGIVMPESLKGVKSLEAPDTERTSTQISAMNKMLEQRKNLITEGSVAYNKASSVIIEAATKEVAYLQQEINKQEELNKARKGLATATGLREAGYNKAEVVAGKVGPLSPEETNKRIYAAALYEQTKYNRMSLAAENTRVLGISGAMGALHTDLVTSGAKTWEKWSQLSKGALISTVTRLSDLASSFGQIGMVVGAAVGAFELASLLFSKNGKEAAAAKEAINNFDSSMANLDRTFEAISTKDPLQQISTESINAKATAINGLIDSMKAMSKTTMTEIKTASWFDTLIGGLAMPLQLDNLSKSAKRFAIGMNETLANIAPSTAKTSAISKLKDILGVDPEDLKALADETFSFRVQEKSLKELEKLGHELANVASKAKEVDDAFAVAGKQMDTMLIAAIPTDPFAKLGTETMAVASKMTEALEDPITALNQLQKVSGDVSKLRFFSPEGATQLLKASPLINEAAMRITDYTEKLNKLRSQEADLRREISKNPSAANSSTFDLALDYGGGSGKAPPKPSLNKLLEANAAQQAGPIRELQTARDSIKEPMATFISETRQMFDEASKKVRDSIGLGFTKAAITMQTATASLLGETTAGISLRADLQKQTNDLQYKQIDASINLVDAQENLRVAVELNTAALARQRIETGVAGFKKDTPEYKMALKEITAREEALAPKKDSKETGGVSYEANVKLKQSPDEAIRKEAVAREPALLARQAQLAAKAQVAAQGYALEIAKYVALEAKSVSLNKEVLAAKLDTLNTEKTLLGINISEAPYLSEATLLAKVTNDTAILATQQESERLDILSKIKGVTLAIADANPKISSRAKEALKELEKEQTALLAKQGNQRKVFDMNNYLQEIDNAKKLSLYKIDLMKVEHEKQINIASTKIAVKENTLSAATALGAGTVDPVGMAMSQQALDIDKESLRNKTALFEINDRQSRAQIDYTAKLAKTTGDERQAVLDQQTATTAKFNSDLAQEGILNASKVTTGKTISDNTIRLAEQRYVMDQLVSVTESLATVFGEVGKRIGDSLDKTTKAYQDGANKSVAITAASEAKKQKIQDDTSMGQDDKIAELAKLKISTDKKQTANAIETYGKEAGALKGMFKEKTAAYKIFSTFEKAMSIIKLATLAAEIAAEIGLTTVSVAASGTRAAAKGTESIVNAMKNLPTPFNFIAGAAMAALVASLIGGAFPTSAPPAGFSAEEQQKVQGTGQEYKNGALVNRAGGVLGDSKAVAKSIETSMETLGKVFFNTMGSGSSNMLKYLKGIQDATEATAKALIGSTLFGEGSTKSSSSSSFLGFSKSSTTVEDAGIRVSATLGNIANGLADISGYENVTSKESSFWGLFSSSNSSTNPIALGKNVIKSIENIFKQTTNALVAAGTALEGSGTRVTDLINQIPIELRASSQGLSATEFAEKLLSEISVQLNAAAEQAFPYMAKYVKIGEEMYSTVARIVKEGETVTTGLDMLGLGLIEVGSTISTTTTTIHDAFWGIFKGISTTVTTGTASIEDRIAKQQQLLKEFDGDSTKFESSIQFYFDNFKSVQDRFQFSANSLAKGFTDLGLPAVKTKKEFDILVNSMDLNSEAGAKLFAGLMELAPAFDKVDQANQSTAKLNIELMTLQGDKTRALAETRAAEYAALSDTDVIIKKNIDLLTDQAALLSARNSQDQKIYGLLNRTRQATLAARNTELAGMDDNLKATQLYINALEDEKSARDAASTAVNNTINSLKGSIKTLQDYQFSLSTGAQGIMTPEQKYAALQQDLLATKAAAMGPIDTPEQLAAQQAAAAKLPQAASAFLTSSQALYASTDKYTEDLASVQTMISETITSLIGTESNAELQLGALNLLNGPDGYLASIDARLISTNALMDSFLAASVIADAAKGLSAASGSVASGGTAAPVITVTAVPPVAVINQQSIESAAIAAQLKIATDLLTAANKLAVDTAVVNANVVAVQTAALIQAGIDLQELKDYVARNTVVYPDGIPGA